MVGGNDIRILERTADDQVHAGIIHQARMFWQSIADGIEPDPVMPEDADAVIRMNSYAEPGKLYDGRGNDALKHLIEQYQRTGEIEREAAENRKVIKAEILQIIGDHEKVLLDGYSVSAGITAPTQGTEVTADMVGTWIGGRAGFRSFRVTTKKAKGA
jgi:hypothetical protein